MARGEHQVEPSTLTARELLELAERRGERIEDHYSIALFMAAVNAMGLRHELAEALEEMPASSSDIVSLRNWLRTLDPLPDCILRATNRHLLLAEPVADLEEWRRHRTVQAKGLR